MIESAPASEWIGETKSVRKNRDRQRELIDIEGERERLTKREWDNDSVRERLRERLRKWEKKEGETARDSFDIECSKQFIHRKIKYRKPNEKNEMFCLTSQEFSNGKTKLNTKEKKWKAKNKTKSNTKRQEKRK